MSEFWSHDVRESDAVLKAELGRPFAECIQGQHHSWEEDFLGEFIITFKCKKCGKIATCWH